MLITDAVKLKVNARNKKYLEELGYEVPKIWDKKHKVFVCPRDTFIEVRVDDLLDGSHALVEVICDYCGVKLTREYRDYLKKHSDILGDCCHKCEYIKAQNTMRLRYGVEKACEIDGYFEKINKTNMERYGVPWAMQNTETLEKQKQTNTERYGVPHVLQNPKFTSKVAQTKAKNHTTPTTKPQRAVGKMLEEMFGNCILEYPCGACNIDCFVVVNDVKIDVEYDGYYFHTDEQRDRRRDNFIKSCGYKVLRIKGAKKDPLPTKEQLDFAIDLLVNSKRKYIEIKM